MFHDFGHVIRKLKDGYTARRPEWKEKTYLELRQPAGASQPFIYLVDGEAIMPYFPVQADILAEDWTMA